MADGEKIRSTRLSQYKPRNGGSSQEERRNLLLLHQKRLRDEAFNEGRSIVEEINNWHKPSRRRKKHYEPKLMLSEWLMEVPSDFEEKWIMVPCPVGKRVLVLAGRGFTSVFAKDGRLLSRFKSNLPGGHIESGEPWNGTTILDCIWSVSNHSYYILDVLAWNNQYFRKCETEFRFFWLRTKLSEGPNVLEISQNNAYPFNSLPTFLCDKETLEICLKTPLISNVTIDGLLFYHLEAHYTTGRTPLVGWLKPFMLPEMMRISVCEELLIQQPRDYAGYLNYIYEFEEKMKKKCFRRPYQPYHPPYHPPYQPYPPYPPYPPLEWIHLKKLAEVETDSNLEEDTKQDTASEGSSVQDFSETIMDNAEEESEGSTDSSSEEEAL